MGYKFNPGQEHVEEGLRRIAGERFQRIARTLENPDLSDLVKIHEVRKSVKRLRSLIRLAGPSLADWREENICLRDAARPLSALRDTSALHEALANLPLAPEALGDLTHALTFSPQIPHTSPETTSDLLQTFTEITRSAAIRAETWRLNATGFDALAPGLEKSYRRLRKSHDLAMKTKEEDALHEWRKAAKIHWHHSLLLRKTCPEAMEAHARMAARISSSLGTWRDAGLVITAINALPSDALPPKLAKKARKAITRLQAASLLEARSNTLWITAETPHALIKRWEQYWQTSAE